METQGCKRVVLRANGRRKHLDVGPDTGQSLNNATLSLNDTESTPHGLSQPLTNKHTWSESQTTGSCRAEFTPHNSPPTVHGPSAEIFQSPPLHLTGSRGSSSSSSSSLTHSTAHKHTTTAQCRGQNLAEKAGKVRKRRWRKGKRVHPVSHSEISTPCAPQQHHLTSHPPSTAAGYPQSSDGYCLQSHSPPAPPPTSDLSCSLPPLLSSQLRKGGRRPSPSVDWSSDGGAELERCLPGRQLGVYVGTWNMQQLSVLPDCLDQFLLPATPELVSELYIVGTQESTSQRREWEVLVQQTLGPSHLLVHSASLGELHLLMFLRRDLLWFCSDVQSVGHATRPGAMIKTKGGIGMSFNLFGTSFLFITSHFTAHQDKVAERNTDMQRIAANITGNRLTEHDYVFWFGDLNYRVDMERETVDQLLRERDMDGWLSLLLHDQLTKEMLHGHVFQGFSEQPIHFPPSYKFDAGSDTYDSSVKQRIPSWTDRILFRSRRGSGISGCGYNLCRSLHCSDHRPVSGVFTVRLEPSRDTDGIPDVMADFDREVYRIAHQRRKEVASLSLSLREGVDGPVQRTSRPATSSVCTIL